jgi:hydrogenase maturation protease
MKSNLSRQGIARQAKHNVEPAMNEPATTPPRILIAGIGNIFMGDDAFGSEVARRLTTRPWPENVRVVDFGIRGYDVAYALMDNYDVSILIDATAQGGAPGTVYVIEPDLAALDEMPAAGVAVDGHTMSPMHVLRLVKAFGGQFRKLLLVGCEPADLGPADEGKLGLSEPVAAAIEKAMSIVESLVAEILGPTAIALGGAVHSEPNEALS